MKILRYYQAVAVDECWKALKENDSPVLLMASVGSGKSLMIADILLKMEQNNKRALCIVNNAELVRNNAATFKEQGGNPSIYCASLSCKDYQTNVVFCTPQSILNGIRRDDPIAQIKFNLIVCDEAHMINHKNHKTTFMRVLRHYKQIYPKMRVLGATGTDFRFKGEDIVGENCFFKSKVGNITTSYLLKEGYLTKPKFKIEQDSIDFSSVKVKQNGLYDYKQLECVIDKNARLTEKILHHLVHVMNSQGRFGCFIFASTKRHAQECLSHLPSHESAIITGETSQEDRIKILDAARLGTIRYLVNISVLTVGVDVAPYDTLLFMRPTESLVLMVQMMGRVLRLAPNKQEALILDCAGNIERHSDWDDPVLLEAIRQTRDPNEATPFECHECHTMNGFHARRCVGIVAEKRCEFFFEFKDCHACQVKNDITSRFCRECNAELIDPNKKLSLKPFKSESIVMQVDEVSYKLHGSHSLGIRYKCGEILIHESFWINSQQSRNIFYAKFVRQHVPNASRYYPDLDKTNIIEEMLQVAHSPQSLILTPSIKGYVIKKKNFDQHKSQ